MLSLPKSAKAKSVKVGLVLAGGGAKGAYQVGVLRYLAELGFQPDIIAGTSIGALNGAVIASYSDLNAGVNALDHAWTTLGEAKVLCPNQTLATQLAGYVIQSSLPDFGPWIRELLDVTGVLPKCRSFFDPGPLEDITQQMIDPEKLRGGTELWVAVFPSLRIPGLGYDGLMMAMDGFRALTGTKADWLRVQDCQDDETLLNLLWASAAIPFCFPYRQVNGTTYVDGALQDNVPLGALVQQGCTHAIVVHLSNGTVWNRYQFPGMTMIEVRPQTLLNTSQTAVLGDVQAMLNFSGDRIAQLKQQGYDDARHCLEPILTTAQTFHKLRETSKQLEASTKALGNHKLL